MRSGARRRLRFGVMTAIILAATTVSCVMANLIARKIPARLDVTGAGEHRLSERTRGLLDSLHDDYEVIVAADWRTKDRRVATRVRDALDRFDGASDRVDTTLIDTGTPAGVADYEALLSRLVDREAEEIRAQQSLLEQGLTQMEASATFYESLSASMISVADSLTGADQISRQSRTYFMDQANQLRSAAVEERTGALRGREVMGDGEGMQDVPAWHQTRVLLETRLAKIDEDQSVLVQNLGVFAASDQVPEELSSAAARLQAQVRQRRDQVAVLLDRISRMQTLDVTRVAGVLTAGEAAVVIGPERLIGIDMGMLLPPGTWLNTERGVEADMGRRAEELLSSAVGALASPDRPIVVVVSGQPGPVIDRLPVIEIVRRRLELQGIDIVEWPVVAEPDHPDLSELNPTGRRTVVYVMIGTDTAPSNAQREGPTGPERAETLGRVLEQLVDEGQRLMISLVPSYLPGIGLDDPTLRALEPFGIGAETGRPIIRTAAGTERNDIETLFRLDAAAADNPLLDALRGLPTTLDLPVGITLDASVEGVTHHVLLEIEDDDAWGEAQWLDVRLSPEQRASLPSPPAPDPARDWVDPPFVVGAAAERRLAGNLTQRMLVMGSYNWFFDQYTNEATLIDERIVATNPGNAELFEAGVLWLAGRDDLIARSPTARATPRISAIEPGRLSALRWILMGGLPGVVLLLGGLWRLFGR